MRSLNELPPLRSSNEFPNFIFKSVESTWTAHSFCEECGVLMNSPLWFLKLQSLFRVPTLFLQNAESARTLHWVFEKCGVHMNSPLCGVHLNCCLVFKNAEFKRTPHCGLKKCGIHINSPLYFYEMCSLLEPPTVFLKNAEFTPTPQCDIEKCGVHFNSPLCFWKMRSSHELPSAKSTWTAILFFKNAEFVSTSAKGSSSRLRMNSSVFYSKMRSPLQLFPVFLKNAEFTWTPPSA